MKHLGRILGLTLVLAACRQDMHDQLRFEPLEVSSFFADGRSARPRVEGTVARGDRAPDEHWFDGRQDGELAETFPMEVDADVLARGREQYNIYCSPCHDHSGYGQGMVVKRGMKQPPSFHIQRLQESPPGYFYDVITNGFGAMYDYSDRIREADRWAIVAYLRALQYSQNAPIAELSADEQRTLEGSR